MNSPEVRETEILTIGHSTYSISDFVDLLRMFHVTAIVDVRSLPFSGRSPQYNRRALETSLRDRGIAYRFFGNALGGRPKDPKLYVGGTADYEAMAQTDAFKAGIDRVVKGAKKHRLALMCSEQDPIECHRCLLVGRALSRRNIPVLHVLPDGTSESQHQIEVRLLNLNRQVNRDLFLAPDLQLELAYRDQGMRVAFTEKASWDDKKWEASDVEYH